MSCLPDPLTPPECDLRDFAFMPLDVLRLRDSGLAAKATGDEFRAAVLLWCACWHQVPAASLPDDDGELAHLCGYGRAPREWKKIKDGALHGFVKCSDGRLYHSLIAEKALEAWESRERYAEKREKDRERLARWRGKQRPGNGGETVGGNETETRFTSVQGSDETRKTGTGRETGIEVHAPHARAPEDRVSSDPLTPAEEQAHDDLMVMVDQACAAGGYRPATPQGLVACLETVKSWREEGFSFELDVLPSIRFAVTQFSDPANSLRCFTKFIRTGYARRQAGGEVPTAREPEAPLVFAKPGEPPIAEQLRIRLSEALEVATYRSWLDPCLLVITDDQVTVVADTAFRAEHVRNVLGVHVERCARAVVGPEVSVRFKVQPSRKAA